MAASTQSPNGFSYAQAAKGPARAAASQTPSSKVTSGTATPATGTFSELAPNSNWADDVEANEGEKTVESRKPDQEPKEQKDAKEAKEQGKSVPVKESAVERTKSESRTQHASSGVSSPDLAASSSNTDDSSSAAPTGASSSDTTWETKSQNSEPAWIAERKERQIHSHNEDGSSSAPTSGSGKRSKKEAKEAKEPALAQPPQKPIVLHEAPPPQVNIWAKRMEDASKTKTVVSQAPKPTASTQPSITKENVRPKTERKKANSITSVSREPEAQGLDSKRPNATQAKKAVNEPRTALRPTTKSGPDGVRADSTNAAPGRAAQREAQSSPNLTTVAPPLVKDESSWPTPESAQEKERKVAVAEKESEDADVDASAGGKARDKPKWTPLPVTPTIVWQTEEMNRPRGQGGERSARGGTTARGRGGLRGGPNGSKGGERAAARTSEAENGTTGRGRSGTVDREAMPPPANPSSASAPREGNATLPDSHQPASAAAAETRHTKPPSKPDFDKPDAKVFEPAQRHASHDIRADDARDGSEAVRDVPTKKGSFETKKESRANHETTYGANGKEYNPRGKTRGGRGRGGGREFANGHQPSSSFTNGHTEYGTAPYGVPQSPSSFQSPRGSHVYGFAQPGRGGWPRGGGPRSQSIPVEQIYGRPPVQTYYPGMYEFPGAMSMTPVPFSPMVDPNYVVDMVSTQLEYYFSLDNLLKDMFLRKNMDTQGFVFLDVIANFNRLKQLTIDKDVIKFVCLKSESIEIRVGEDGKDRLRRREGWEQFVLPKDQREVGAQTDGPQTLHRPEPVQLPYWPGHSMPAYRGPPSAGLQGPRGSHDSGFAMNGGVMQFAPMAPLADASYGDFVNGEEHRGRAARSPLGDHNGSPSIADLANGKNTHSDVFADDQIGSLLVVVRPQPRAPPHHNAASRTFSNGSIDTRSVYAVTDKEKSTEQVLPSTNGEPLTNGDKPHSTPSRHASPSLGRSPEKTDAASELMLLWAKDSEIPRDSLPEDSTSEPYVQLRVKALDQRGQAATGACPYDLDVLYQFWSHFLIRNFNNKMYNEFKYFASNDAQERRSSVGLQNLVQFYAKALASSNPIRDHIVRDYVDLVKDEPLILGGQAHKQLRQAWRDGALNLKNRKKLADILDDSIKQSLEA